MHCKSVQESISLDERLSDSQDRHLRTCQDCQRFQEYAGSLSASIGTLRTPAPAGLREKIRRTPKRAARRLTLASTLVTAAAVVLIAAPAYQIFASRHKIQSQPDRFGRQMIGEWPTYHDLRQHFQMLSNAQSPKGQVDSTQEFWFDTDAVRETDKAGFGLVKDLIIRLEGGRIVRYERDLNGELRQTELSKDDRGMLYPNPTDLRWFVGPPREFKRMPVSYQPDETWGTNSISVKTITDTQGEDKIVSWTDRGANRILKFEHYGSIRDEHDKIVAKLALDFRDTLDYAPIDRRKFDPSTLARVLLTTPAIPGPPFPKP